MERPISGGRGSTRPSLRTYSKRPTSNGSTEPASKKRRIDDGNKDSADGMRSFARRVELPNQPPKQSQPQLPPPAATCKQSKKGSILSYFKVTSPSSGIASACEQSSEPAIPSSTPPSSPAVLNTSQRKRRRLTTKPVHQLRSNTTDAMDDSGEMGTGPDLPVKGSERNSAVLQDIDTNVANRQTVKKADKSGLGKRGAKKRQRSTHANVQTTLSLSLTEKQFVECEDCNMLYNPYHEKDVKLHARQHAALRKTTKSAIRNE